MAKVGKSDKLAAHRQREDVDRIESIGVPIAARISGRLRQRAISEYKSGHRFLGKQFIISQLLPVTTKAMVASHLKGMQRSHIAAGESKKKQLLLADKHLSPQYSKTIDVLAKQMDVDVDALQRQYATSALRVLNKASDDIELALRGTLNELIETGASAREAIKVLGETFDNVGISPSNPFQLETIFRTQSQIAYSAGRWQADQDPDIQEILWGYKYVTVGDMRVREEHAALDGITLPKYDIFWRTFWTPNGYNCRCQIISIFDERKVVRPPTHDEDGDPIQPDKGFAFHPGLVYA